MTISDYSTYILYNNVIEKKKLYISYKLATSCRLIPQALGTGLILK